MKLGLMVTMIALLALPVHAQELKPLPDMSSSKVPQARDAEAVATTPIEATSPALSAEVRQEITPLVEQLGANDAAIRRLAKDKLKAMGQQAFPVLLQYTNATDPEVRLSVKELLELDTAAGDALLKKGEELLKRAKQAKANGNVTSARKQFSQAAALFAKVARDTPHHRLAPRAVLVAGQCHLRAEDLPSAIRCFKSLAANYPEATERIEEALYWLGDCHAKSKDYVSAARDFEKLVLTYPESKWAKYARGRLTQKEFDNVERE